VFSDWVFAEKNKIDKNITEDGFQVTFLPLSLPLPSLSYPHLQEYLQKRDLLLAHLPIPQITVYLDVSPNECYRRVHHLRGRVRKREKIEKKRKRLI
jgi:deoxyadenosine/deoxycytidine kinase